MRAYLVDEEPLAIQRLTVEAIAAIRRHRPDVVFLDIQMPEMSGFDVLTALNPQPFVVFTTAYDAFALKAFEVNSVDYLLKPIEASKLQRALGKLERIQRHPGGQPELRDLLARLALDIGQRAPSAYPERLPSRLGDHVELVEVRRVTHFFAHDKLTYAVTPVKRYVVDLTIQELEDKLDPKSHIAC